MSALSTQIQFVINSGAFTTTSVSIPATVVAPDGSSNFYSIPEKGDGYYMISDGMHTVTYTVTPNFSGILSMQGTLSTNPGANDWFTVPESVVTYNSGTILASTTTNYVNFVGNFVYVRAVMQRSGVIPNGDLNFINYNH